ncbi:Pectate lyase superfamily protein [Polystyrenella longa]|uniref:Pectate lyase superfamily protein n=1 Tax=Polystyrenella longa TaxID=2528007 RepID=A0A518CQE0_9PLAN|nr:right-handed parallel beta-helix repeat-containing protein [Polystyrenella longa]QDU81447.1 Pectate lyase superfamily protein [Polystyrenella longa]
MKTPRFNRRSFLGTTLSTTALATGTALWGGLRTAQAADRPAVVDPRATSGDVKHQPAWDEMLTITVGQKTGDLTGKTDKAIQAAVDYVSRLGGGTVNVLPGEYRFDNGIQMSSQVRLTGSGSETIFKKNNVKQTELTEDSDWFDQEVTFKPGHGFNVGDGVCLITKNTDNGTQTVLTRTLVARSGDRFKLDRALRNNYWKIGQAHAKSLFSLIQCDQIHDIEISNLVLDGNRENNPNLNGNYGGNIFAQDCHQMLFQNVESRNYNGDGFSWQICHDVTVENCHSHHNADLGLHPGSGSQRPIIRNCKLDENNIGIFFCWGVKFGLAEENEINACRQSGISVGHRDTHNLITKNKIRNCGEYGILFRPERGEGFTGDHNRVEENELLNNGAKQALGIDIQGMTANLNIVNNQLKETRSTAGSVGIQVGAETSAIQLDANTFTGFATDVKRLA